MDILAQRNLLIKIVAVLTVLNLVLLGYMAWKTFRHDEAHKPVPQSQLSQVLQKELGLTQQQADSLKAIRAGFFEREKALSDATRAKRDSMNKLMFGESTDDALLKRLASEVSANEYQMELLRIEQAAQLRTVCTPEQLKKLNKLVIEIRDYLKPENDKK